MKSKEHIFKARKEFCLQLKEIAKRKGITQTQIAERTGLKEQANIARIFAGKYAPGLDLLLLVAEAIECKIAIEDLEKPSY
jgi:transcriptional regulator with XRE-family HTH domain